MRVVSYIFGILLLLGCATARPLTDVEKRVRLVAGTQQDTLDLARKCKEYPGIIKLPASEYHIRIYAAKKNKNTAQLIYEQSVSTEWVSSETMDIKLWDCP